MIAMHIDIWHNLECIFLAGIAEEDEAIEKKVFISSELGAIY